MRHIAGLLMIVTFVMHLLLGGGALISSKYEELRARTEAGDLSDVAGDLVDEQTLEKERTAASKRADTSGVTRKRVVGVLLSLLAVSQFATAILLFLGRGRAFVYVVLGLSIPASIVAMALERVSIIEVIGVGTLVLALVLVMLTKNQLASEH